MDSGTLVDRQDFEEGKKAIAAIKNAQIFVRFAFWAHFDTANEWRLIVVSPAVEGSPRSGLYAAIQREFTTAHVNLPLRLVVLASPKEPVAQLGLNYGALVGPFGGRGIVSTSTSGSVHITLDPRYIYRDDH